MNLNLIYIPFTEIEKWRFVDTLQIVRSLDYGCVKLQCLRHNLRTMDNLQAHRALDDCFALRSVIGTVAAQLGVSVCDLVRPFSVKMDADTTVFNLSCLGSKP